MTEQDYKEHLCSVIKAVFAAEDAISKEWQPLLQQAIDENWAQDGRMDLYEAYIRAVAEECLKYEKFEG